jgi:hypothetical protein
MFAAYTSRHNSGATCSKPIQDQQSLVFVTRYTPTAAMLPIRQILNESGIANHLHCRVLVSNTRAPNLSNALVRAHFS